MGGGGNKGRIKKTILMAPIQKGGLKAPDMITQNLVWKNAWISRLQEGQGKW